MSSTYALKHIRYGQSRSYALPFTAVSFFNISLALLAFSLLTYYIVQANVIAADAYRIKSLQDEMLLLQEQNTSLLAEKSLIEDASVIQAFAQQHNMVSAGRDAVYLFESSNVALVP
jgi:hypothetical protein